MSRFIELTENHRTYDKFGRERLWTPGPYMAPEQMPDAIADQCLKLGSAKIIERTEVSAPAPERPFRAKRKRRSKGAAPENKAHLGGSDLHRGGDGSVPYE